MGDAEPNRSRVPERPSALSAAWIGLVACGAGMYASTVPGRITETGSDRIVAQGIAAQTAVFYNAHLTHVTMAEDTIGGEVTANVLLTDAFAFDTVSVPPEAFFAIPPVLLVVGGPMLAEVGDDRKPITRSAMRAG